MLTIWTITKRELRAYFDSLMAYILLILFVGFSGFFTWLYGQDVFLTGQASLRVFFSTAYWTLFFFIPAITMRLIAEEKNTGTIELLLTKAITDWQVVWGKFLAALLLILTALVLTLPYYITITQIAKAGVDHGAILCGYLALFMMSAVYISIGLFASSLTTNQIVAFLVALFIGIFFHIIFDVLARNFTGFMGQLLNYLSLSTHYDAMSRGVIDSKNLVFFLSLIVFGLVLTELQLEKRNING